MYAILWSYLQNVILDVIVMCLFIGIRLCHCLHTRCNGQTFMIVFFFLILVACKKKCESGRTEGRQSALVSVIFGSRSRIC